MADLLGGGQGPTTMSSDASSGAPAPTNYGSIFGYSAEDSQRGVEYYDKQPLTHYNGPVADRNATSKVQKTHTYDDEFTSYRQMVSKDPEQFKALQAKLYAGGFYNDYLKKGETPNFGRFDATTGKAINDAIQEAILNGEPVDDVLNGAINNNSGGIGPATAKTKLTSPEQIKALVQSVAPRILGRRAPQEVIDTITSHLHGLQSGAGADGAATGDDVTSAPTANSAWFEEQLKELMPQTAQANTNLGELTGVQSLLSNPQGPLGNLT